MFSRWRWVSAALFICLLVIPAAAAQDLTSAELAPPDTEAFPQISTYLDVHDSDGSFLHGLQADDVRFLEDGRQRRITSFRETRPGVQVVLALNPGRSFVIQDSQGFSRYDYLADELTAWAGSREGSTVDDLSLAIRQGPENTHFADPGRLASLLNSYHPEDRSATPDLNVLSRAIDLASDPPPRSGMERVVLFLTSPLEGDISFNLQELISRAKEVDVHIFVGLVASPEELEALNTSQLQELAVQTGGVFFNYSPETDFPDLESFFEPMRPIYSLTYQSRISQGGAHTLAAEISLGEQVIKTPVMNFEFDLQPPNPAFISPPSEIVRTPPEEGQVDTEDYLPRQRELRVLIDFPDGRSRSLEQTRLWVDGQVIAENGSPPFDRFNWDLSGYQTSGQHLLKVDATDELGLSGASIETLVEVRVERPEPGLIASLAPYSTLILAALILLSGTILAFVLILGGRINPSQLAPGRFLKGVARNRERGSKPTQVQMNNPPSETGAEENPRRVLAGWINRLQWPQRRLPPNAEAYLKPLEDGHVEKSQTLIPITGPEVTFGRDPRLATALLEDPSVEALHARLVREADGSYHLVDEGSIAGTWINFEPVPAEGSKLEHGDIVHFGRAGFRFTQRDPQQVRKVVIRLEDDRP